MRFAAIVLAGGASVRMEEGHGPVDKVALEVAGRTLLHRVVDAAGAAGAAPIVCVGPARPDDTRLGVTRAIEHPVGSGPAAALAAGLVPVDEPGVVLLAGDLPFLAPAAISALVATLDQHPGRAGSVACDDDGCPQWLLSAWRAAELRAAVPAGPGDLAGRSLRSVLEPLSPLLTALPREPAPLPSWFDCDTPADLAAARLAAHGG